MTNATSAQTSSATPHAPADHPRDRRQLLATLVRGTNGFLTRFLAGFDDRNRTSQGMDLPNHVSWTLGHCAMTMHRVAERIDGQPYPPSDFIVGDPASPGQGDAQRYDTTTVGFGSTPVDDPVFYPTLRRGREIYESACERLAAAIENAPDSKLDEPQDWHGGPIPLYTLIMRVCFHNGTHAGQLTDLRRALRLPNVIVPNK